MTPPVDAGLLAGITREFVLELAAGAGLPVREHVLRDDDLFGADEAFLTSTTREVVPIVQVERASDRTGPAGPITQSLLAEFRKRAQELTRGSPSANPKGEHNGRLPFRAYSSTGGHVHIRLRSPKGLSMRPTLGQNLVRAHERQRKRSQLPRILVRPMVRCHGRGCVRRVL